jgi:hypothetical protein
MQLSSLPKSPRNGDAKVSGERAAAAPPTSRVRFARPLGDGWKRAAILSSLALTVAAAPIALAAGGGSPAVRSGADHTSAAPSSANAAGDGASPIRGGIHNPPYTAYSRTTGIFGRTEGWTNRVENVGSGGALTLGCHAPGGGAPCLSANNQSNGLAFAFNSSGNTGGEILLRNTGGAPFTTNAHGVAAGLNANYLEGKQANEFQLANQPAANANALGGHPASSYVSTGQLLFADVGAGPVLEGHRGATAVTQSTGGSGTTYTVTFGTANLVACSFTASPQGAALTGGQLGVEGSPSNPSTVIVRAPASFTGGFDLQVVC